MDTLDVSACDRWERDLEVVRTLMLGGLAEFLSARCGAPLSGDGAGPCEPGRVFKITCLVLASACGPAGTRWWAVSAPQGCVLHEMFASGRPCWPEVSW